MLRPGRRRQARELLQLERRNLKRSFKLLWINRLMVLLTTLVVVIAMTFPSSLLILARNMKQLAGNWEHDLQVQVFVDKQVQADERKRLYEALENHNSIQSYKTITAAAGLTEFAQKSNLGNLITTLGHNPLPDVVLVKPVGQNTTLLENLLTDMAALPGVASASFDQKWAQTLASFFGLIDFFTLVVLQLLLVGLFVLIAGNVNALVLRSANEIRIIKLIGATNGFVSRPYIYFGSMVGLLGGIGSFVLVVFILTRVGGIVESLLASYAVSYSLQTPAWWELLFILIGPMLLGMFAAILSCRSAISMAMPDFQ